jgi:hypothetical protein
MAIEKIARLVGHASSHVNETVYRQELRPVLQEGAEVVDRLFGRSTATRLSSAEGRTGPRNNVLDNKYSTSANPDLASHGRIVQERPEHAPAARSSSRPGDRGGLRSELAVSVRSPGRSKHRAPRMRNYAQSAG